MKINLTEIPAEGRSYDFNRESAELNDILADLIQDRPYDVAFTIKPIGNAYELRGSFKTHVAELCSRCGYDIELPIRQSFNEILVHDEPEYRKAHSVHGNQSVDFLTEGPSVTYYQGQTFNASEFIHEAIAIAEPFYPNCGVSDCENLKEVEQKRLELEREFKAADERAKGHPAFAILKQFGGNGESGQSN